MRDENIDFQAPEAVESEAAFAMTAVYAASTTQPVKGRPVLNGVPALGTALPPKAEGLEPTIPEDRELPSSGALATAAPPVEQWLRNVGQCFCLAFCAPV